ncbi:tripartite AtP-independent periplasmic transporter subunit DctQ [Calderihabitans maritimus]|uniref:Tripartite AtP-independent periplasmic transporter subunit DctQ n=2 Tax=Calderihabitans maritimus TaxID=1246530 RepID=A0A1Z5HR83_9FIRM|nr:tripartite AtP-independent periplasmic transporter subunit DctQ [Calderihabitans maritimus]
MIAMLIIMVGSISVNVVARYFGMAFTWIDEVSRLTFVWMSCMAIVAGLRRGLHPSFVVLLDKTSGVVNKLLLTVINTLILLFLVYLLKGGIDYISKVYIQKTAILGISVAWKYAAVPFATIIMILEVIRALVLVWKKDDCRLADR